jgi:hypothetical protein
MSVCHRGDLGEIPFDRVPTLWAELVNQFLQDVCCLAATAPAPNSHVPLCPASETTFATVASYPVLLDLTLITETVNLALGHDSFAFRRNAALYSGM